MDRLIRFSLCRFLAILDDVKGDVDDDVEDDEDDVEDDVGDDEQDIDDQAGRIHLIPSFTIFDFLQGNYLWFCGYGMQ